jgi:hypothetical protein
LADINYRSRMRLTHGQNHTINRPSRVQRIVGSGTEILNFAVDGKEDYYTWDGNEEADRKIEYVASVQNIVEYRFIIYSGGRSWFAKSNHGSRSRTPVQFTASVSRR